MVAPDPRMGKGWTQEAAQVGKKGAAPKLRGKRDPGAGLAGSGLWWVSSWFSPTSKHLGLSRAEGRHVLAASIIFKYPGTKLHCSAAPGGFHSVTI